MLILSVDSVNCAHIQNAETAKEVWDNLKKVFDYSGVLRRMGLLRELVSTRLENTKSMEEFVNKIVTTAHKLKGAGIEFSDEVIGAFMLADLSDEYMPMIMAIENSGKEISADLIKTKLLRELKSDSRCSGSTSAMVSRSHGSRKQNKKLVKCFGCGGVEHYKNKCSKAANQQQQKSGFFSCLTVNHFNSNDWFIDSGASAHMTNNKTLLDN